MSPVAATPGYVLLRAEATPLSVAKVRRRLAALRRAPLARAADEGAEWLAVADAADPAAGLIGEVAGVPFRIVAHAEPFELPEQALAHLDGEEQQALRGQRAYLLVERRGAPGDDLAADYRALGPVAAALLDGALGIGARQHGTFELADERARDALLGEDPLDALAPQQTESLVVFVRASRNLDEQQLKQQLQKATSNDLDDDADELPRLMVHAALAWIRLDDVPVILTVGPAFEFETEGMDLRARKLAEEHGGLLHLAARGVPGPEATAARQRALARVAAALWGDDCLGINWSCDPELLPMHDDLLAQLRSEDPVAATLGRPALPVLVPDDQAAMDAAIAEARKTWDQALAHLAAGGELSAKFPFRTSKGEQEHIWVTVLAVADGVARGTCGNEPVDVPGLKLGDEVRCKVEELSDWLFVKDGELVGGFTVKVMREQMQRRRGKK